MTALKVGDRVTWEAGEGVIATYVDGIPQVLVETKTGRPIRAISSGLLTVVPVPVAVGDVLIEDSVCPVRTIAVTDEGRAFQIEAEGFWGSPGISGRMRTRGLLDGWGRLTVVWVPEVTS